MKIPTFIPLLLSATLLLSTPPQASFAQNSAGFQAQQLREQGKHTEAKKLLIAAEKSLLAKEKSLQTSIKKERNKVKKASLQTSLADVHLQLANVLSSTLHNQGMTPKDNSKVVPRAIAFYQKSYDHDKTARKQKAGVALQSIGDLYKLFGKNSEAISYFGRSIVFFKAAKDKRNEGFSHFQIGESLGNTEQSVAAFNRSLAIWVEVKDLRGQIEALNAIGSRYYVLKQYPKVIATLERVVPLTVTLKSGYKQAEALSAIGDVYQVQGQMDDAIKYYEMSWPIYQQNKINDDAATDLLKLMSLYKAKNELPLAIERGDTAVQIMKTFTQSAIESRDADELLFADQMVTNTYNYLTLFATLLNENGRVPDAEALTKWKEGILEKLNKK